MQIILFACSCQKDITGKYLDKYNGISPNSNILCLNEDKSFLHETWSDVLGRHIVKGSWYTDKDTLSLLSLAGTAGPLLSIEEEKATGLEGIRIRVFDKVGGGPLIGASIYINDSREGLVLDTLGQVYVKDVDSLHSITVDYLVAESIRPSVLGNNDILIGFDWRTMKEVQFHFSQKWLVKRDRIMPLDERDRPMPNEVFIKNK